MKVTPEVIEALAVLRKWRDNDFNLKAAVDVLDNAGVFREIDEATGYDVDPAPESVSKCTCVGKFTYETYGEHLSDCPGDPAEWGDLAFRAVQ